MQRSTATGRIALMAGLFAGAFGTGQFHRMTGSLLSIELTRELGLDADTIGLISAAYFISSVLVQIPIGVCLDRFGPRRTVPTILVISVVGTIVFANAHTPTMLFVGRALMGAGYASTLMAAYSIFARWVPADRFATVSAFTIAAGSIGGVCGTAPFAFAVEWFGWRATLIGTAWFTVGLIVLLSAFVRDAPPDYVPREARPTSLWQTFMGLGTVLRDRQMHYILAMGLVTFGPGVALIGLWGGPFLSDIYGLDTVQRGNILFLMALAGPVGAILVGPLDRLLNARKLVIVGLALLSALDFALLALFGNENFWGAVVLMILVMLLQAYYVTLQGHCRSIFPDSLVGRATTTLNLVSVGGVAIMQIVTGAIVDYFPSETGIAEPVAYRVVFAVIGAMIAVAALIYARVEDKAVRPL